MFALQQGEDHEAAKDHEDGDRNQGLQHRLEMSVADGGVAHDPGRDMANHNPQCEEAPQGFQTGDFGLRGSHGRTLAGQY